jgi:HTH-type transcriptional regulator/antitoxin HipB
MKNKEENIYTTIIGLAIKAERKKRNLTQTQLAELSNTIINFVSRVEYGKKLLKLARS